MRAQQTATAIANSLGGAVNTLREAGEVNFGRFEGIVPAELTGSPEAANYALWENGGIVEDVESLTDAADRTRCVLNHMMRASSAEQQILVTHGVFIRVFVCVNVFSFSPSSYRHMVVDNASVSILQLTHRGFRLAQLNARCDAR
jgi:broad specificity phosphatase PhoE